MAIDKREYRLLVIEDNQGDFALVEEFLYEQIEAPIISHVKNYKGARELLLAEEECFDVVLLDLSLPDKTGEPLIREIIEICPNTPIIVLTGYADFRFGIKSLSLGVSDYMLKDELTSLSLYKSLIYSMERKKNIFALQESEKRYSELFHLSPLPMWVFDLDSLQFLDVNKATIRHYRYSREEFLSMTLTEIKVTGERDNSEKILDDYRSNSIQSYNGIFAHRIKTGEIIQVDVQSNVIEYRGKRAVVTLANDITERLRYIKAIEDQNEKLREISWIQSHIVRAPLARIMGLIQLFKESRLNGEEGNMMLDYLTTSANELDEVIKSITNKTKISDYEK